MLYKEIEKFMEENDEHALFTGGIGEGKIKETEENLKVQLPDSYKWFLSKYYHGGVFGVEIFGYGLSGSPAVVEETMRFRRLGLSEQYVVIENCDEWINCLDTSSIVNGECTVISWDMVSKRAIIEASSFSSFLLEEFKVSKEGLE